jgi:O-antigen biosynthesis protein
VSEEPVVNALGRLTDELAEKLAPSTAPASFELPWDTDASSVPPNYWHWLNSLETDGNHVPHHLPTSGPLLSVLVPIYRPQIWYFRECVLSVFAQSYSSWELCLCDDGSEDPELTEAIAEFAATDSRIKVAPPQSNGGISRATNSALRCATGEFTVLLDHDDVLAPGALAEIAATMALVADVDLIYSDEDKLDELDRPFMPHFKPDWDPDLLLAYPYLGHVMALRTDLLRRIGGFRSEFDGSQDYDVMLRASESARSIVHIPKVLYHWRVVPGSAAGDSDAKPWAHLASRRVLEDTLVRRNLNASVETGPFPGAYHVRRHIEDSPTVSIIIPFRDQAAMTMACLDSLEVSAGYEIAEIVLIDNGSVEPETKALRRRLEGRQNVRLIDYPGEFNWAAINNFAASTCHTDMLLFLNNDTEATSKGWLHSLVELGQREDVGAVGARLVFPDGKLQHAGVVLGLCGIAGHLFVGMPKGSQGYFAWDRVVRGYSAVTAACMLVRRDVFEAMNGFDLAFAVGFNDVDFCVRLGRAGYRVLYTPHAELIHRESVTRGLSGFNRDYREFLGRWMPLLAGGDPSYNPNLGRLEPWCPLRPPGEDEEWLTLLGEPLHPIEVTSGGELVALIPVSEELST